MAKADCSVKAAWPGVQCEGSVARSAVWRQRGQECSVKAVGQECSVNQRGQECSVKAAWPGVPCEGSGSGVQCESSVAGSAVWKQPGQECRVKAVGQECSVKAAWPGVRCESSLARNAVWRQRGQECSVKPVLNWANVCSPEHTSDTSTNYASFLNWTFSSSNMVRTVQTLLHSQLACNEMQASFRTCGRRAADSMIENVG